MMARLRGVVRYRFKDEDGDLSVVIEGDADVDLFDYPDNLFDFSILTYALQATKSPKTVLSQLVRISRKSI